MGKLLLLQMWVVDRVARSPASDPLPLSLRANTTSEGTDARVASPKGSQNLLLLFWEAPCKRAQHYSSDEDLALHTRLLGPRSGK